jgi:hypothetical protein
MRMLSNDASFNIDGEESVRDGRGADDDQRKCSALARRWLPDSRAQRRHRLAAILAVMAVRRTMHRPAALHGLLGRSERIAVQCITRESQGQDGEKNSLGERHPFQVRGTDDGRQADGSIFNPVTRDYSRSHYWLENGFTFHQPFQRISDTFVTQSRHLCTLVTLHPLPGVQKIVERYVGLSSSDSGDRVPGFYLRCRTRHS